MLIHFYRFTIYLFGVWSDVHNLFVTLCLGHKNILSELIAHSLRRSPVKLAHTAFVANRLNMKGTGGSDAHGVMAVGTCYTNFEREVSNEEDLIGEIKEGRFKARNDLILR